MVNMEGDHCMAGEDFRKKRKREGTEEEELPLNPDLATLELDDSDRASSAFSSQFQLSARGEGSRVLNVRHVAARPGSAMSVHSIGSSVDEAEIEVFLL
jgi:hypothetical protein